MGRLAISLGGRASEMVVFDEITNGAESDLKYATGLARRMVGIWGMSSEVGPVYLGTGEEHVFLGREIVQEKAFSDTTDQAPQSRPRDDRGVATIGAAPRVPRTQHRDPLYRRCPHDDPPFHSRPLAPGASHFFRGNPTRRTCGSRDGTSPATA